MSGVRLEPLCGEGENVTLSKPRMRRVELFAVEVGALRMVYGQQHTADMKNGQAVFRGLVHCDDERQKAPKAGSPKSLMYPSVTKELFIEW
ncbi:MAG: hypothetical protein IIW19_04950 [Clostridia bacterium]|nr:hypothetical protein [Clostridia bacterium]